MIYNVRGALLRTLQEFKIQQVYRDRAIASMQVLPDRQELPMALPRRTPTTNHRKTAGACCAIATAENTSRCISNVNPS